MNWIDAASLFVIGVSALMGLWRGLVKEGLSLAGWFLAVMLANWQASRLADLLPMQGWAQPIRHLAAYVLIVIGVLMAMALVSKAVQWVTQSVGLGPINRLLGVVFGLLRGVVILMVAVFLLTLTPWLSHPDVQASRAVPHVLAGLQMVKGHLPQFLSVYLP